MFGEILRKLLTEKELTQKEAAQMLGIDTARFNSYVNNKAEPNFKILIKIADLFQISVDELLGRPSNDIALTEQEQDLLYTFRQLDRRGRYKAIAACVEELDHMLLREKEKVKIPVSNE